MRMRIYKGASFGVAKFVVRRIMIRIIGTIALNIANKMLSLFI